MEYMGLNEIRERFLKYFEENGHLRLASASLVPQNDKSLLVINSGMAPLKPYFARIEQPPSLRVTSCQKCLRTNDIDNVGITSRHGSFFEMLGNFSFGDYFKEGSIKFTWDFLLNVMGIPESRLFASVYEEDDEAYDIWHNIIGLPKEKIFRMGKDDNFWEVGLGPCGPCSEVYFDRGEEYGCGKPNCTVGCDCDRYIEIWNNVFTQFNKNEDGTYTKLAYNNIDTGMGLERLGMVMQGVTSLFDLDTLKMLRDHICKLANYTYNTDAKKDISVRVITDHVRSITFMISDGILPSNEGRGYVLRRLLRRAARHGRLLGIEKGFLPVLAVTLIDSSKQAYPELAEKQDYILKLLTVEENRFFETIDSGLGLLRDLVENLRATAGSTVSGTDAFKLYDTYGFPLELMEEELLGEGFTVDREGFYAEMEQQRTRGRASREASTYMGAEDTVFNRLDKAIHSTFTGYDKLTDNSQIIYLIANDTVVESVESGTQAVIITENTPFYARSGGQNGDIGAIITDTASFIVTDTQKVTGDKIAHFGHVEDGTLYAGQTAKLTVDIIYRLNISANHSVTHLLHKALKEELGNHVEQAGSQVREDGLRFDFTHFEAVTTETLRRIERRVNDYILMAMPIDTIVTGINEAKQMGAVALFGEKYGSTVRVVNIANTSIELCGGTHVANTSLVSSFRILSESGIAAGVRRIEAVTREEALKSYHSDRETLENIASAVNVPVESAYKKITTMLATAKEINKEFEKLRAAANSGVVDNFMLGKTTIGSINVVIAAVEQSSDVNELRAMGDKMRERIKSGVVITSNAFDGKITLIVSVTDDLVKKGIHAGNLVKKASQAAGGSGGGKPNMAQAGLKDATALGIAIEAIKYELEAANL